MFKFVAGVTTGWIAARSIYKKDESPLKVPTYDEIIELSQKAKEGWTYISKKLEEMDSDEPSSES